MRAKLVSDVRNIDISDIEEIYHFTSHYNAMRIIRYNELDSRIDRAHGTTDEMQSISTTVDPLFYKRGIYMMPAKKKTTRLGLDVDKLINDGYRLVPFVYKEEYKELEIRIYSEEDLPKGKRWELPIREYLTEVGLVKRYYKKDPVFMGQLERYLKEEDIPYNWI